MSFLNDLFGGADQPYPTTPTGPVSPPCGDQPFTPPEPDSFLSKIFAPKQLSYPLPACPSEPPPTGVTTVSSMVAPTSSTMTPVASPAVPPSTEAPAAAAPVSPVTVVITMPSVPGAAPTVS